MVTRRESSLMLIELYVCRKESGTLKIYFENGFFWISVNSEVALLRKQLTDSLEQISTSKKDMEKVLLKNEALQTESQSLKSTIGSLETQLTHK